MPYNMSDISSEKKEVIAGVMSAGGMSAELIIEAIIEDFELETDKVTD